MTHSYTTLRDVTEMLRALNRMLQDRAAGLEPGFDSFIDRFGDFFDPDRPANLDDLLESLQRRMAAMRSLMDSMSPEARAELEAAVESALDVDTRRELAELAGWMQHLAPPAAMGQDYRFLGGDPVTLDQAMELMTLDSPARE